MAISRRLTMKTFGLILAGGKSSRFSGDDKAWIEWKGKPMIQYVIDAIRPQVDDIIISANKNLDQYQIPGYTVLRDISDESRGPLEGILTATKYLASHFPDEQDIRLLTVPCDMPLIPENLSTLLDPSGLSKQICVARDAQRIQSLVTIIPLSFKNELENFLSNGQRKVETWILSSNPVIVDLSECADKFYNVNSQADLEKLDKLSS